MGILIGHPQIFSGGQARSYCVGQHYPLGGINLGLNPVCRRTERSEDGN